jgi:hypothetical protein
MAFDEPTEMREIDCIKVKSESAPYMREPPSGSVWKHHSGRLYTVLFLANGYDRVEYPRTVVYVGTNGKMWAGKLADWHRRMTEVVAS